MAIFEPTEENISKAAELILNGELVSFATETVYGLGANALNPDACEKIFKAKERPHYDPLIVHIHSIEQLTEIAEDIPQLALKAATYFWPGPLTMVLKKKNCIPDSITANLDTVAVRMPKHPLALALLKKANVPIAAPSANPFGYLSPTTAEHVESQLGDKISMVLDGGECECGVESTIIDFTKDIPQLLRHGGIPKEEIESICGLVMLGKAILEQPLAPGQLASHYSPDTKLVILSQNETPDKSLNYGIITHSGLNKDLRDSIYVERISPNGDLKEAAHNLFSALHRLDNQNLDIIYAYEFPEDGLGAAIMDRLRKAAFKIS
ncbi:MAG: L-threonylcarbamoyladenylate synthase [Lentisphaeraceae bacterium]|nr:L-threonylcarbamoyladenylate synthase [Lentisphaeraceae bacterium]